MSQRTLATDLGLFLIFFFWSQVKTQGWADPRKDAGRMSKVTSTLRQSMTTKSAWEAAIGQDALRDQVSTKANIVVDCWSPGWFFFFSIFNVWNCFWFFFFPLWPFRTKDRTEAIERIKTKLNKLEYPGMVLMRVMTGLLVNGIRVGNINKDSNRATRLICPRPLAMRPSPTFFRWRIGDPVPSSGEKKSLQGENAKSDDWHGESPEAMCEMPGQSVK